MKFSETSTKIGLGVMLFQAIALFYPDVSNDIVAIGTAVLGATEVLRRET